MPRISARWPQELCPVQPPADQFYGDRSGGVRDPFGNQWWIATHIEDVPPAELKRRAQAAMEKASGT